MAKQIKTVAFLANDGTQFTTEHEAVKHDLVVVLETFPSGLVERINMTSLAESLLAEQAAIGPLLVIKAPRKPRRTKAEIEASKAAAKAEAQTKPTPKAASKSKA